MNKTKSNNSQQEKELRPELNPNKSQGYNAGKVAYRNSGQWDNHLNTLPADNNNSQARRIAPTSQENVVSINSPESQQVKTNRKENTLTKSGASVSRIDECCSPTSVDESDKYVGIAGKTNQRIKELKKAEEYNDVKDANWIDGQITGVTNSWIDLGEDFAVFYKEDLIDFYNKAKLEATTQTLKEVEEVIDNLIKSEEDCMKNDTYEEQIMEHENKIEMAKDLKKKLGMEEKDENYK